MQKFNHHTHTYRCKHADNNLKDEDYVKEFIKKGFTKITFTDHAPQKEKIDKRKKMRMEYEERLEYLESIKKLKEKYKGIIEIETGYEVEYLPDKTNDLLELKNEVDKIVLGQHFIYDIDNKNIKIFRHQEFTDEDLIKYAYYIKEAIENKIPDIIVHPDLYMLSRNSFKKNERKVAKIICETAEKYDVPLEINLTEAYMYIEGLKQKIDYPNKDFWNIAKDYNIKVLYGIDAHFKEQIKLYEESIELVNKIIGDDIINKLNFVKDI